MSWFSTVAPTFQGFLRRSLTSCCAIIVGTPASAAAFDRFNDTAPETEALEIWRITGDPTIRHHSNYHDVDPFSPDGRYIIYTIKIPYNRRIPDTFAVYDLREKREIYRQKGVARHPIWARSKNVVYWTEGAAPEESGDLWQLELPAGTVTRINRDLPREVLTISYDDRYLYASGPPTGRGPQPWVIWRIEARPDGERKIVYRHPKFPEWYAWFPKANPSYPVILARQNPAGGEYGWTAEQPARILLDLDGKLLGPAVAATERTHTCWSGDGRYLVRGDGPLRAKGAPFLVPGDWQILSAAVVGDPFPCGASGQWMAGIGEINDKIYVADAQTGYTRLICYAASLIHQPGWDKRDLSDPYDSDPFGSPDGTKIFFSTNYAIKDRPITQTRFRTKKDKAGGFPDTLEVISTAGFPESGVLSLWDVLVKYGRKEPTRFLECRWGYGDTRVPVAIDPEMLVTDYAGRCLSTDENDPLQHQASTDVYIAVVRKPDAPGLSVDADRVVLRPAYNHRETCAYSLYVDGKKVAEVERATAATGVTLSEGGSLFVTALEWSGLESESSETVPAKAGMTLVYDEATPKVPALAAPERVLSADGALVAERYFSPQHWPCQVVEYRSGGTRSTRKLYRAENKLFSEETYDQRGRRVEEKVYNLEGNIGEQTRFEEGSPIEREILKYGLYPVREKRREDGTWKQVDR